MKKKVRVYKKQCMDCGGPVMQNGGVPPMMNPVPPEALQSAREMESPCAGTRFGGPDCPKGSPQYEVAKSFRAGAPKEKTIKGSVAPQNQNINDVTGQKSESFKKFLSRNATNAIAEDEIFNAAYDYQFGGTPPNGTVPVYGYQGVNPHAFAKANQQDRENMGNLKDVFGAVNTGINTLNPRYKEKTTIDWNNKELEQDWKDKSKQARQQVRQAQKGYRQGLHKMPTTFTEAQEFNQMIQGMTPEQRQAINNQRDYDAEMMGRNDFNSWLNTKSTEYTNQYKTGGDIPKYQYGSGTDLDRNVLGEYAKYAEFIANDPESMKLYKEALNRNVKFSPHGYDGGYAPGGNDSWIKKAKKWEGLGDTPSAAELNKVYLDFIKKANKKYKGAAQEYEMNPFSFNFSEGYATETGFSEDFVKEHPAIARRFVRAFQDENFDLDSLIADFKNYDAEYSLDWVPWTDQDMISEDMPAALTELKRFRDESKKFDVKWEKFNQIKKGFENKIKDKSLSQEERDKAAMEFKNFKMKYDDVNFEILDNEDAYSENWQVTNQLNQGELEGNSIVDGMQNVINTYAAYLPENSQEVKEEEPERNLNQERATCNSNPNTIWNTRTNTCEPKEGAVKENTAPTTAPTTGGGAKPATSPKSEEKLYNAIPYDPKSGVNYQATTYKKGGGIPKYSEGSEYDGEDKFSINPVGDNLNIDFNRNQIGDAKVNYRNNLFRRGKNDGRVKSVEFDVHNVYNDFFDSPNDTGVSTNAVNPDAYYDALLKSKGYNANVNDLREFNKKTLEDRRIATDKALAEQGMTREQLQELINNPNYISDENARALQEFERGLRPQTNNRYEGMTEGQARQLQNIRNIEQSNARLGIPNINTPFRKGGDVPKYNTGSEFLPDSIYDGELLSDGIYDGGITDEERSYMDSQMMLRHDQNDKEFDDLYNSHNKQGDKLFRAKSKLKKGIGADQWSQFVDPAMKGIAAIGNMITEPQYDIADITTADQVFGVNNRLERGYNTFNKVGVNDPFNTREAVQYTGQYAKYGGSYQEGGEYELTDEEIEYILKNGGQIEFI